MFFSKLQVSVLIFIVNVFQKKKFSIILRDRKGLYCLPNLKNVHCHLHLDTWELKKICGYIFYYEILSCSRFISLLGRKS